MDKEKIPEVISVVEETVTIGKETVETGRINVRKTVIVETVTVNTPIVNQTYQVSRHPAGSELLDTPPPALRSEGDKTIISVIREVSVVVKKYQVIEEIHLSRNSSVTPLVQEIDLKKERVKVTRTSPPFTD